MRRKPIARREGGFTLIEVIAALVVFSLGALAVMGLTVNLARQLTFSGLRSKVAVEVQDRLDSLQLVPYDSLMVGTTSDTVVLLGKTFKRTQSVLQTTPLVKEVEVSVDAADGAGPRITSSAFVLRSW
ncbi:prepilin-type N-terminal cleavage/methylation domain-containing protein [Gemmatimonadota bacterium]